MTRETKLGLVVGTSFLSLAAVVAYSAWSKTEEEPPVPERPQIVQASNPQGIPGQENKPTKNLQQTTFQDNGKSQTPGSQGPGFDPKNGKGKSPLPGDPGAPVPVSVSPLPQNLLPSTPGGPPATPGSPPSTPRVTPSTPGGPSLTPGVPPLPPGGSSLTPASPPPSPPGGSPLLPVDVPPAPVVAQVSPAHTPASSSPQPAVLPGGQAAPGLNNQQPLTAAPLPGSPQTKVDINPRMDINPKGAEASIPPSPLPGGVNTGKEAVSGLTVQPPLPFDINPKAAKATSPEIDKGLPGGVPGGVPVPKENPLPPLDRAKAPTEFGAGNSFDTKQPPLPGSPLVGDRKGPADSGPIPVVSGQGGASVGSIPLPKGSSSAAGGPAKPLDSFDERRYFTQPGDTDFAAISNKAYGSPKWDQALKAYNSAHPIGKTAAGNGSQLQPNSEIYIPPVDVLERKYPTLIGNAQTQTAQPVPVVSSAPGSSPLPGVANPNQGSGSPVPTQPSSRSDWTNSPPIASAPPAASQIQPLDPSAPVTIASTQPVPNPGNLNSASYKIYTVPAGGKPFYEIARDTLGNGSRWPEIYNLNTQYDPVYIVPAGSQLKLPAGTRTGQ